MKDNNAIALWRIIFTYMIVAFHFTTTFPWMGEVGLVPGWYLAVEFFFMVSGYLICDKFDDYRARYNRAIVYTFHRYINIWPRYIVSFFITFAAIFYLGKNKLPPKELLYDSIYEIFLLQGIGLDRGWDYVNPTLWYLSIMLICGFFIFLFLRYIPRFFKGYLGVAIILLFLFLLYENKGALDSAVMQPGDYANYPLWRGMAEMCLGTYACMLNKKMRSTENAIIWKCTGAAAMILGIVIASTMGHSKMDFLVLGLFFIGVSCGFLPDDTPHEFINKWSSFTLEIYLIHEVFRTHVFPALFSRDVEIGQKLLYMLIYMISVTAAGLILHLCHRGVRFLWEEIKR